jgi:hypothetical protein
MAFRAMAAAFLLDVALKSPGSDVLSRSKWAEYETKLAIYGTILTIFWKA